MTYQVFFDSQTDIAIAELDRDIRRSVRATLRTVASPPPDAFLKSNESFLSAWDGVKQVSVLTNINYFSNRQSDLKKRSLLFLFLPQKRRIISLTNIVLMVSVIVSALIITKFLIYPYTNFR